MSTSRRAARHFDAEAAREAIALRADWEMARLRQVCRRVGITPERVRQWKAEDPDRLS